MPVGRAEDVDLDYETVGEGDPLVFVHGSWNDHGSWQPAIDAVAGASFRVISYDRRGHGRSEAVPGQGTRRQDEDDLAALIEGWVAPGCGTCRAGFRWPGRARGAVRRAARDAGYDGAVDNHARGRLGSAAGGRQAPRRGGGARGENR
ncbi:alpha/beta fold hydrolase [Streptomyces sp. NRRL WC-3618]|uniref:alpha/beta fold hydrolase n=1 Tax=Streptomyces sp. NRRL WC-3618 TaxID=1519490 RepID=UPI000A9A3494|nr:alpha/beta fold hydrolase [Streptomyces sp. NRRL WC-3618]